MISCLLATGFDLCRPDIGASVTCERQVAKRPTTLIAAASPDIGPSTKLDTQPRLLTLDKARWRLAVTWFPSCGVLFLVLVSQSLAGAYGTQVPRAWGWALPTFLPTLALMLSVFAADALKPEGQGQLFVRRNFCNLALSVSIFYLVVVFLSLALQPLVEPIAGAPDIVAARLDMLELSNIWLSPLQSIVVAAIGVLFFLKEHKVDR